MGHGQVLFRNTQARTGLIGKATQRKRNDTHSTSERPPRRSSASPRAAGPPRDPCATCRLFCCLAFEHVLVRTVATLKRICMFGFKACRFEKNDMS